MAEASGGSPKNTPLTQVHEQLGAKLVDFAGYRMPLQYDRGIVAEHGHTRSHAGLFDISHMGQAWLIDDGEAPAAALERLVPGDLQALEPGRMRYTLLLNDRGGIVDDFMVTRPREDDWQDRLFLVVNAARKDRDFRTIQDALAGRAKLQRLDDHALIALQGPEAAAVMSRLAPEAAQLAFMSGCRCQVAGVTAIVTRSGYTGEDGFEVSVPAAKAEGLFRTLLDQPEVAPIGLGARDSLRLEAGLCLYGHDLDEDTTPVEASLTWTVGKRRRETADFPGAGAILQQIAEGAPRKRVGLLPRERAPVREGTELADPDGGQVVGRVTSGGYGPTVGGPVAMGYVDRAYSGAGTELHAMVRGRARPVRVVKPPFVGAKAAV
jgi:aminomethyltransferase